MVAEKIGIGKGKKDITLSALAHRQLLYRVCCLPVKNAGNCCLYNKSTTIIKLDIGRLAAADCRQQKDRRTAADLF